MCYSNFFFRSKFYLWYNIPVENEKIEEISEFGKYRRNAAGIKQ